MNDEIKKQIKNELKSVCCNGNLERLKNLIADNEISLFDSGLFINKLSPLMYATRNGHTNLVEILIQAGVNINRQDETGETALIIACRCGFKDIAELLLINQANYNIKTDDNKTALVVAIENGHFETIDLLLNSLG
jgi:ankyrin repeat protein